MNRRMLDKKNKPTKEDMIMFCENNGLLFEKLNDWLITKEIIQDIVFPYGNNYGWCIASRKNKKLICNVFPEEGTFTVMMHLSNKQFDSVYNNVGAKMQECISNKYSCGDGGWVHYCINNQNDFENIIFLLEKKLGIK